MATASEWLQAMVTPDFSKSTITAPGLSARLGVPAKLPDRRCMMAWQVGALPSFPVLAAVVEVVAGGSAAAGALGCVEACARGNVTSAANVATAISNRVERRNTGDADDDRDMLERDGMTVKARGSECACKATRAGGISGV